MGAVTVVRLGAWCDFVTEDEYRQRLVRHGGAHKGPLESGYVPVPTELPSQGEEVERDRREVTAWAKRWGRAKPWR